jgi:hypothetical protein
MMDAETVKLNNYAIFGADIADMNADREWQCSVDRTEFYQDNPNTSMLDEFHAYERWMDDQIAFLDSEMRMRTDNPSL